MITKVNGLGKAGLVITNIAKVILWFALAVCLVSGGILLAMPQDFVTVHLNQAASIELELGRTVNRAFKGGLSSFTEDDWSEKGTKLSLELNGQKYEITDRIPTENGFLLETETKGYTIRFKNLAQILFLEAVVCAAALCVMHFTGKLCKLFCDCETPFTEEIADTMQKLAVSILPMALLSTLANTISDSILTGNMKIVVGIELETILLILLIFMLSTVFRYGTKLQQESDETL